MTVNTPNEPREATPEVAPVAVPDGERPEELQSLEDTHGEHVRLAEDVAKDQKPTPDDKPAEERTDEVEDADRDTDGETDSDATQPEEKPEEEETSWLPKEWSFAGVGAWLSSGWSHMAKSIEKLFTGFKNMLPDWLVDKEKEEEDSAEGSSSSAKKTEAPKPVVNPTEGLTVNSWEEVLAIADLPTRIVQAALYAYATDMDCFTKDGNHCSGWCDSVFNKAGLETIYDVKSRIYCHNYKGWGERGTLQGLKILPGDTIIFHNGNSDTGDHHFITLSAEGPDPEGNYTIRNVSQPTTKNGGERKVRTQVIAAKDIRVINRPGASEPWGGDETNLVA